MIGSFLEWDENEEWWVEEDPWGQTVRVLHKGIVVEADALQVFREIKVHRYFPKYFIADEQTKRAIIARALWTRLQKHQAMSDGRDR